MGFFEDLLKKDYVKDHPMLSGYKNAHKVRESIQRHAQELEEDDLMDEFSENNLKTKNPYDTGDKAPKDVLASAFMAVRDMIGQFEWPMTPRISFNNFKDVKKAVNDPARIVSGLAVFNMEFKTKTGVSIKATVPVTISRGEAIPPSTMDYNGSTYIFAQSTVNDIVKDKTIFKLDQMRGQFSAPFMKEDRAQAVAQRNMSGWSPVENDTKKQRQIRMSRFKGIPVAYEAVKKDMDKAIEDGKDSFPKQYIDVLQNYVLNHISVAEYDQWYPALVNDGYVLNQYGKGVNRGRSISAQVLDGAEDDFEYELDDSDVEETSLGGTVYPGTKTPIEEGDSIKFMGNEGMIRGNVLEIQDPYLIVKSKGVEYRVMAEDVQPLPKTFKKMYANSDKE
jgi:hypothetical protein